MHFPCRPKAGANPILSSSYCRFVAQARGEMAYYGPEQVNAAVEGCKSNAMMRCCKDLGVASELWDPRFIREFIKTYTKKVWVENITTKKKKQIWMRKDTPEPPYPWKAV